jgi:hypothetical protein
MSIAGGHHHALETAGRHRSRAVQIFTKNSNQWAARPLDPEAIRVFEETRQRLGPFEMAAHDSYLINLGSPDTALLRKSLGAFIEEITRCEALGIPRRNIILAYWDPYAPEHIKDGQISVGGVALTPERMTERYARVAEYYLRQLRPEIVMTMAPYEFMDPPNDHWACATGVTQAARAVGCDRVVYNHSGVLYQHIYFGREGTLGERVELPPDLWEIKLRALHEYLRWDPSHGWFATAAHSVPMTFRALLTGGGRFEYQSTEI